MSKRRVVIHDTRAQEYRDRRRGNWDTRRRVIAAENLCPLYLPLGEIRTIAVYPAIISKRAIKGGYTWNLRNVFNFNINLCSEAPPVRHYMSEAVHRSVPSRVFRSSDWANSGAPMHAPCFSISTSPRSCGICCSVGHTLHSRHELP